MQNDSARRVLGVIVAALTAVILFVAAALPAAAMTVTFVRHGESEGNASGFIDTSVPGPNLTPLGQTQAEAVAAALMASGVDYDAVYASNMVRTTQTAQPFLDATGLPVTVLPGVRELGAGIFEGQSEKSGLGRIGYGLFPVTWILGARFLPIPGSQDGNSFDARVDDALQQIEDSGAENAVVFSHGATMMFWTMMNVDNPDLGLLLRHPLGNTDVVVIDGSNEEGWTLKSWAGQTVGPASLGTKLFVNFRDLVVTPQTSVYNVARAFSTGDISQIATAIRDGVIDTVAAPIKFATAVVRDVVDAVSGALRPASVNAPAVQAKTAAPDVASVPDSGHRPAKKTVVERVAVEVPAVTEDADTDAEELNGATDLTDGNKVAPGVAHEVSRSAEKLREAAEGVSKQVEASLTKLSDAVAKATGQAGGANESGDAGDGAAAAEKDAA
jgi:broad specificity phosphatase PhoE